VAPGAESGPGLAGRVLAIGNLNVDLVFYPVRDLPAWGEERTVDLMLTRAAGSAGYSALVLGNLGMRPVVIGNVGCDGYRTFILRELTEAGADVTRVQVSGLPTGVSATGRVVRSLPSGPKYRRTYACPSANPIASSVMRTQCFQRGRSAFAPATAR